MKIIIPALVLCALFLSGCVTSPSRPFSSLSTSALPSFASIDEESAALLAQEYRMMAELFKVNGSLEAAAAFASKAGAAQGGQWVYPDQPPQAEDAPTRAYDDLNGALLFAMSKENAPWLAKAQVNYDCWVNIPSQAGCRRNFDRAMQGLTLPDGPVRKDAVYFESDSSEISPDARAKLQIVAGQMRMSRNITLKLIGHSNGGARNPSLALRRAIALRNIIAQMGVSPERIMVDNEAHTDTILSQQRSEKGGDPAGRRVDIVMEPVFAWRNAL